MNQNFLKSAFRVLQKYKVTSVINIAGLAVGFASFLLIVLVIKFESSFDDFHKEADNIYRVVRVGKAAVNREYRAGVPFPVTDALRKEIPQVENAAAIFADYNIQVIIPGEDGSTLKKFKEPAGVFFAGPQFFAMFNFPAVHAPLPEALTEPNTVMLTKATCIKYFGDLQQAVGKTIRIYGQPIRVTGIIDDLPENTDFPLKLVISYATLTNNMDQNNWGSISDYNYCFIKLRPSANRQSVDQLLAKFVERHIKPVNQGYDLSLQPLTEMHYDARFGNFNGRTFSHDLIFALGLIGLFLLVIACVNFVNLTTAQAASRAREVGVRKVLGGSRRQLVWQFLGETALTTLLALSASLLIVLICAPLLGELLEAKLAASQLIRSTLLYVPLCSWILVTVLAGLYPALLLSGFKPATVLKAAGLGDNGKGILLRRSLAVFQFLIAQVLIISTLIVASQMDYFRRSDMGFLKEAVITASFPDDSIGRSKMEKLRNDLNQIPGVRQTSFSSYTPASTDGSYTDLRKLNSTDPNPDAIVSIKCADTSYFSLYQLHLLAGRVYFPSDTVREFVVNETVIRKLGIMKPEDAIGKMVNSIGVNAPIIGVIKDFHTNSLRDPIVPVLMVPIKNAYNMVNIKIDLNQRAGIIDRMKLIWNSSFPDYVFEYSFLDQSIASYYKQENRISQLYKIFSAIAIFISSLGLYGLILFMAIRRKKEIGIRKVLGAPVKNIVVMLCKEFTLLVALAFLIASPIAYYLMHEWLQQYAFRIPISIWYFLFTIAGSMFIAWMSVGYTAIKAAFANPVKSLRTDS